jgi:mono/diheme cytochrome c family protein
MFGFDMRMEMKANSTRKFLFFVFTAVLLVAVSLAWAQQANSTGGQTASPAASAQVARGKYIVNSVAMCTMCHTPRDSKGEIESSELLSGASVFYQPAHPMSDWPNRCPRIAGNPPGTDQEMVTLLTTGIWKTGQRLRQPMPQFRMTREDAEAVVAYLKTLR